MNGTYKVITLCGSTKFKESFLTVQKKLTLAGYIVISVGLFGHADNEFNTTITPDIKNMLDEMHQQKIDMSDAIFVINENGYIGNSTNNEIEYAKSKNKEIFYLEYNCNPRCIYPKTIEQCPILSRNLPFVITHHNNCQTKCPYYPKIGEFTKDDIINMQKAGYTYL